MRKVAAIFLLASFASSIANAGEPLIVTKLADAESHLLALDGSPAKPSAEQRNADFINALTTASAAREQATDAQCRNLASIPAGGAARMTWEANCRYRRR